MSSNKQRRDEAMKTLEHEIKSRDLQEKTKPLGVVVTSVVVILAVIGAILFFATRNNDDEVDTSAEGQSSTSSAASTSAEKPQGTVLDGKRAEALPATVSCEYPEETRGRKAKDVGLPPTADVPTTGSVTLTLATNKGEIPLSLNRSAAPCAVNAMTYLASKGYFNDSVCHRLTTSGIKVLQCGDPTGTGTGGPGFSFADEYPVDEMQGKPVVYPRGSVAMANSGKNTNGSQFFLNYGDSPLAASYTYFGTIEPAGLKTLDSIAAAGTQGGKSDGAPAEEVKITSATVSE